MAVPTQIVRTEYFDTVDLIRAANVTGTPLVGITPLNNGQMVPGIYDIVFSGVSGASATATVSAAYSGQSQHGVGYSVTIDGLTINPFLRGIGLTLSASTVNGWALRVYAGAWIGSVAAGNPSGDVLDYSDGYDNPGLAAGSPGGPSLILQYAHVNISGQLLTEAYSKIRTPVTWKPTSGTPLFYSDIVADLTPKYVGGLGGQIDPYLITFANLDTAASPDEIDMLVDGSTAFTANGDDGSTHANLLQLKRDGGTLYQITSGGVSGWRAVIDAAAVNSDAGSLFVYPKEWLEITPSVGGNPGARDAEDGGATWGTDPFAHQAGAGAARGEIDVAAIAYGYGKVTVPSGARYLANPVKLAISLDANVSGPGGL